MMKRARGKKAIEKARELGRQALEATQAGSGNNHPYFVAMQSGVGSGLFTFDADGNPVNPHGK